MSALECSDYESELELDQGAENLGSQTSEEQH
jgi:hypothetical protein